MIAGDFVWVAIGPSIGVLVGSVWTVNGWQRGARRWARLTRRGCCRADIVESAMIATCADVVVEGGVEGTMSAQAQIPT